MRSVTRWLIPALVLLTLGTAACSRSAGGAQPPPTPSASTRPAAPSFQGLVDLPGVNLYYTDSGGSGVPIIFGHAHTGNADIFQPNIAAFTKAGYRVITYDRRGSGRSTPNPATGPQPSTTADDLQSLADYLKLARFDLIGEAHGGDVAVDYTINHPDKVLSVVIVSSGLGLTDSELNAMRARLKNPVFDKLPDQFKEVSFDYMATNPDGLKKWGNVPRSV